MRHIISAIILCVFVSAAQLRAGTGIPLTRDGVYEAYDALLEAVVLGVGRSRHRHERAPGPNTGSRFVFNDRSASWIEGNRVMYQDVARRLKEEFDGVQRDMIRLGQLNPPSAMTRNEQLSYWLNLHNLTLIHLITDRYPVGNVRRFLFEAPEGETPRYEQPFADIDGKDWSLADIEQHIFTSWDDPHVMYGLFYGAVGSPNIRHEAYRPNSIIWVQLTENADEFINSIRGSEEVRGTLRVSSLYKRAANLFPDFEKDVRDHVLSYVEKDFWQRRMSRAKNLKANLKNWRIADLNNGKPIVSPFGPSFSLEANIGFRNLRFPPHAFAFLRAVARRHIERTPTVTVEPISTKASTTEERD